MDIPDPSHQTDLDDELRAFLDNPAGPSFEPTLTDTLPPNPLSPEQQAAQSELIDAAIEIVFPGGNRRIYDADPRVQRANMERAIDDYRRNTHDDNLQSTYDAAQLVVSSQLQVEAAVVAMIHEFMCAVASDDITEGDIKKQLQAQVIALADQEPIDAAWTTVIDMLFAGESLDPDSSEYERYLADAAKLINHTSGVAYQDMQRAVADALMMNALGYGRPFSGSDMSTYGELAHIFVGDLAVLVQSADGDDFRRAFIDEFCAQHDIVDKHIIASIHAAADTYSAAA